MALDNRAMIDKFRQILGAKSASEPAIPPGQRIYAVGDIHGRLDLLVTLAWAIEEDDAQRGPADTTIILLGDLIDRGPDSALVLCAARDWQSRRNVRIILGNHEEMFLKSFSQLEALSQFLRFGGHETVLSYGVNSGDFDELNLADAQQAMVHAVPDRDIDFIETFEDAIAIGDYLFVHAGIRPGKAIDVQNPQNTRWIREPFISSKRDHGPVVVHGHTITDEAVIRKNRIGLDTGAYMSGKLTALGLEGTGRWLLEASERDGKVVTTIRQADLAE